jgi:hypothetical protein
MEELLTGRSIELESATTAANKIVVATLSNAGEPDAGAPGQSYYENASADVVRWLHGPPEESERPKVVTFAYTVQKLPEAAAEQTPAVGRTYLLFLVDRAGSSPRAIKLLPADEKHVRAVERALSPG